MTRLVRYFCVGGAAALMDFLLFAVLVKSIGVPWYYAAVLSFVAATSLNYLLSIRFVFDSGERFSKQHEVALVFLVSGMGLALNQLALYILISVTELNVLVSKLAATAVVFFWNFGTREKFIFRKRYRTKVPAYGRLPQ
jgi:putative flippase GtrA